MRALPGRVVFIACIAAALSGCELDKTVVPSVTSQVAVHSVLDPSASTQTLLLERVLTGTVTLSTHQRFDPLDPINTADGIPIAHATVTVTGGGITATGLESQYSGKPASYGAGLYFLFCTGTNPACPALQPFVPVPGTRYSLTVKTPDGTVVTGTTVVPTHTPPDVAAFGFFNRDVDSLHLAWLPVVGARSYGVRVESPFAAFEIFSDTMHLALPGDLRNFYASDLPRVFIPGFQQWTTVYAADTNYFDYFRSRNDPFTGSGVINKLQGGIGLFGSIVVIQSSPAQVTQNPRDPAFEGYYDPANVTRFQVGTVSVYSIRLYVESTSGAGSSLSGFYTTGPGATPFGTGQGILGTRIGSQVQLQFLQSQDSHNTLTRFTGVMQGDSLVGSLSSGNRLVYRRRPNQ